MDSTAIRHDFSFPPKSSSSGGSGGGGCASGGNMNPNRSQYHHNNNNNNNTSQQCHYNMSKAMSTSLLSCAPVVHSQPSPYPQAPLTVGPRHVSSRVVSAAPNYGYGCTNASGRIRNKIQQYQQQQQPPCYGHSGASPVTQSNNCVGAPGTPKDGNCSFTFDELKNTLSFMDDSPLVNPAANTNNIQMNATKSPLTVNPNLSVAATTINTSSNATMLENHSLHSGGSSSSSSSSSSGMSSISYTLSSTSNCTDNGAVGVEATAAASGVGGGNLSMTKSQSNPMLLSTRSSASSLSSVTSPVSSSSSSSTSNRSGTNGEKRALTGGNRHSVSSKSECGALSSSSHHNLNSPNLNNHHYHQQYHHYNSYHNHQHRLSPSSSSLPPQIPIPPPPPQQQQQPPLHHQSSMSNDIMQSAMQPPVATAAVSGAYSATNSIESAARKYRFAAQSSEATCCWKGKLPPKQYKLPLVYSTKVFVGGLPWDICEADLIKEFGVFGLCRVEWTNKDRYNMMQQQQQPTDSNFNSDYQQQGFRHNRSMMNLKYYNQQPHSNSSNSIHSLIASSSSSQSLCGGDSNAYASQVDVEAASAAAAAASVPASNANSNSNSGGGGGNKQRTSPGFAYIIYESEYSVRALVSNCIEDYQNGRDRVEYYYKISTRRVRNKEIQIIPWILADNNFATCTPKDLDPKKTVFVGNLHGTMTARDLAHIMNELFGSVVYAGIDIDKLKYPIGSGRVTFAHQQNFMRAVRAAFVDIQAAKFAKRIQIDPYLEDVLCCSCMVDKGIYFCRDFQCFNYYCAACWEKQHSFNQMGNHKPLMRKREEK